MGICIGFCFLAFHVLHTVTPNSSRRIDTSLQPTCDHNLAAKTHLECPAKDITTVLFLLYTEYDIWKVEYLRKPGSDFRERKLSDWSMSCGALVWFQGTDIIVWRGNFNSFSCLCAFWPQSCDIKPVSLEVVFFFCLRCFIGFSSAFSVWKTCFEDLLLFLRGNLCGCVPV